MNGRDIARTLSVESRLVRDPIETNVERRAMGADAGIPPIGCPSAKVLVDLSEAIALARDRRPDVEDNRIAPGAESLAPESVIRRPSERTGSCAGDADGHATKVKAARPAGLRGVSVRRNGEDGSRDERSEDEFSH